MTRCPKTQTHFFAKDNCGFAVRGACDSWNCPVCREVLIQQKLAHFSECFLKEENARFYYWFGPDTTWLTQRYFQLHAQGGKAVRICRQDGNVSIISTVPFPGAIPLADVEEAITHLKVALEHVPEDISRMNQGRRAVTTCGWPLPPTTQPYSEANGWEHLGSSPINRAIIAKALEVSGLPYSDHPRKIGEPLSWKEPDEWTPSERYTFRISLMAGRIISSPSKALCLEREEPERDYTQCVSAIEVDVRNPRQEMAWEMVPLP